MDLGPFSLNGKRALVTGGGRGIGRACAQALALAGAQVLVTSRTRQQLEETAAAVRTQGGVAQVLCLDLAAPEDLERLVQAAEPVDILVNNAGISPIYKRAEQTTPEEWEQVLRVNLNATFRLTRAIGPRMVERQGGAIVNITSIGARRALPRLAAYCAGKAALDELTRVLAVEWASSGVRVNAVAPAFVETAMTAGLQGNERLHRQIVERTPLGRFGRPEEVAWAVVFLASEAASYITGTTLFVDGGWTSL